MRLLAFVLVLLLPVAARAAATSPDPLTVYVMTFAPGDEAWEKFGHNALCIRDAVTGTNIAYNWGMFDFNAPHFYTNFVQGRLEYWMEGFDAAGIAEEYREQNRGVHVQVLNLTPAQKLALRDMLRRNALPENRNYRYDYYRDNCSTRVRDAIDQAAGGRVRACLANVPTGHTFRWHTRRLSWGTAWLYTFLQMTLGNSVDRPISAFDECFLPEQMIERLRKVTLADAAGNRVPLVGAEFDVFIGTRGSEPAAPPRAWPIYLAIGASIGVVIGVSARRLTPARSKLPATSAQSEAPLRISPGEHDPVEEIAIRRGAPLCPGGRATRRIARLSFSLTTALWGLVAGGVGCVGLWGWLGTDHIVARHNVTLMQIDPLLITLTVLGPMVAFSRGNRGRAMLRMIAAFVAVGSLIGLLVEGLPNFRQANADIICLALPANLSLAWAALRFARPAAGGAA